MGNLFKLIGVLSSLTFYAVDCIFLRTAMMIVCYLFHDAILRLAKYSQRYGRFVSVNWQGFGQQYLHLVKCRISEFTSDALYFPSVPILMRDVIHCLRGTDFCPSHPFRGTIWGQNYEKNMKTGRKYGEKEKMQILIKSLIFRTLQIYIFSFYAFLFFVSLADT